MATLSGSVLQSVLPCRKRRTRSASEQATRKYSCTKRSPCPMLVESSGYSTRVRDSAVSVSATAPTKSPRLNSWKSKKSGAVAAQTRVGFLLEQAEPIEVFVFDGLLGDRIEQEIGHVVGQRAADEKLHRQII